MTRLPLRAVALMIAVVLAATACGSTDTIEANTAAPGSGDGAAVDGEAVDVVDEDPDQATEPTAVPTAEPVGEGAADGDSATGDSQSGEADDTNNGGDLDGDQDQPEPTAAPADNDGPVIDDGVGLAECSFESFEWYRVVNVADDDPDGGLIVHTAPALESPENGVLPAWFGGARVSDCRVGPEGIEWLRIPSGWVSGRFFAIDDRVRAATERTDLVGTVIANEQLSTIDSFVTVRTNSPESGSVDVRVGEFVGLDAQGGEVLVTYDVADDSVAGYTARFVLNVLRDDNGEPNGLLEMAAVQLTPACTRGVSDDGLCI